VLLIYTMKLLPCLVLLAALTPACGSAPTAASSTQDETAGQATTGDRFANINWVSPCPSKTPCAKTTVQLTSLPESERAGGTVYRGSTLSLDNVTYLSTLGIRKIIDLEVMPWHTGPEEKFVRQADASLPQDKSITLVKYALSPIWTPDDDKINDIMKEISTSVDAHQSVYVHCALGRDRTGMVIALHRVINEGWAPADAYQEWEAHGFNDTLLHRVEFRPLDDYFHDKTAWHPN
jgi:hypothetical protein